MASTVTNVTERGAIRSAATALDKAVSHLSQTNITFTRTDLMLTRMRFKKVDPQNFQMALNAPVKEGTLLLLANGKPSLARSKDEIAQLYDARADHSKKLYHTK